MKDSITNESKSKLDAKLTDNVSIKFTDYAINNFQYDFKPESRLKQGGVKFSNSGIKGLKLFQYKKSKKKYFIQQFWFNKRSNVWTVGEFRLGIFEVKDCRTKVVNIMESHTDDDGRWIKNPKITERYRKDRITKAELANRLMLTVRECIVRLCKADFPKIKKEGTLTSKSAIDMCLPLIGYNKRTKHLVYNDDEFGNGSVSFKACKQYNTVKPTDWDDLFSKFPPGHGCTNFINGRKTKGVSMYDHDFGKYLIEELTPGIINTFLDEIPRGWSTKRKIIDALQILWASFGCKTKFQT